MSPMPELIPLSVRGVKKSTNYQIHQPAIGIVQPSFRFQQYLPPTNGSLTCVESEETPLNLSSTSSYSDSKTATNFTNDFLYKKFSTFLKRREMALKKAEELKCQTPESSKPILTPQTLPKSQSSNILQTFAEAIPSTSQSTAATTPTMILHPNDPRTKHQSWNNTPQRAELSTYNYEYNSHTQSETPVQPKPFPITPVPQYPVSNYFQPQNFSSYPFSSSQYPTYPYSFPETSVSHQFQPESHSSYAASMADQLMSQEMGPSVRPTEYTVKDGPVRRIETEIDDGGSSYSPGSETESVSSAGSPVAVKKQRKMKRKRFEPKDELHSRVKEEGRRHSLKVEGTVIVIEKEGSVAEFRYNPNMRRSFAPVERTPEEARKRELNNIACRKSRARAKLGVTRKYVRKNRRADQ